MVFSNVSFLKKSLLGPPPGQNPQSPGIRGPAPMRGPPPHHGGHDQQQQGRWPGDRQNGFDDRGSRGGFRGGRGGRGGGGNFQSPGRGGGRFNDDRGGGGRWGRDR